MEYTGEKIGIPLGIWFITSSITQVFRKYGDIFMIKSLFQTFIIELWPIWIGAICVALYLIVKSLINFLKDYNKSVENAVGNIQELTNKIKMLEKEPASRIESDRGLGDRINKLEVNISELREWIGLFSYKNQYSDLKGKIKVYIKEELEKESTDRKAVDTAIVDKLSSLTPEIEDIRTRIPRRAITNKI